MAERDENLGKIIRSEREFDALRAHKLRMIGIGVVESVEDLISPPTPEEELAEGVVADPDLLYANLRLYGRQFIDLGIRLHMHSRIKPVNYTPVIRAEKAAGILLLITGIKNLISEERAWEIAPNLDRDEYERGILNPAYVPQTLRDFWDVEIAMEKASDLLNTEEMIYRT